MNTLGRQRSGAPPVHHQRQYSDNYLEASSNGRWLQSAGSAGLQHLQSSNIPMPPTQDFGYQGSSMYRGPQRSQSGGSDLFEEPLTPQPANNNSRRRNGDEDGVSANEYSPGLLDLHSFDTELLPELHALVEFQTQESAEKAVELLHDQRDWRKGLRVRCLLRRSPKSVLKNRKSAFDSIFVDDDGFLAEFSPYVQPQTVNSDTIASNHIEEYYSTTPKKSWNKGRGKARQQIGRGLLAANPLLGSNSSNILGEVSSPRLAIKGPRMPDGTKGFTMGRGRIMAMQ